MRLVVDAEYYVSVGHDGEDQRRVALADKADPGVVGVVAGAYGESGMASATARRSWTGSRRRSRAAQETWLWKF